MKKDRKKDRKNRVIGALFSVLVAAALLIVVAALLISYVVPLLDTILADAEPNVKTQNVKKLIIIDPGHGGEDPGAVGVNGSLEKELNLELALTVCELLRLSGFEVIMTRTDDRMLSTDDDVGSKKTRDLAARVAIAEEHPDALFVSLHMNKFSDPSVKGTQIYYSKNDPESRRLAGVISDYVRASIQPSNERPIKEATSAIYLLDRIKTPAVLVECGFLSNAMEEALLRDNEYRTALACAICGAVASYSGETAI